MKKLTFLFLLILMTSSSYSQVFLNGSFENNFVSNCLINNITNAQFDSVMSNVRGIGSIETIDIIYDTDCPLFEAAQDGNYFVSVENNSLDSNLFTALSLAIADTLFIGNFYQFSFYDKAFIYLCDSVQIGVSNTDSTFGSLIYTSPLIDTVWTERIVQFTSPITANYITVKMGSLFSGAFVDHFGTSSLSSVHSQIGLKEATLFPNPFSSQLICTTSFAEQAEITFFDFFGRLLLKQTFYDSIHLNTEDFESGIYFYQVRIKSHVIKAGKLIKP